MKGRWLMLLLILPFAGLAEDRVLADVLARLHEQGSGKYRYQEIRRLELLDVPVQAQGYMLTDDLGTLIKLQLQPKRVIMAIAGQSMYYWDPGQNRRHSAPLSQGGAAAQQIAMFRSVLRGRIEDLQPVYDFAAETHGKHWTLRLTPKQDQRDASAPRITISGDAQDQHRSIIIEQADGEASEYSISQAADDTEHNISALLREVTGD